MVIFLLALPPAHRLPLADGADVLTAITLDEVHCYSERGPAVARDKLLKSAHGQFLLSMTNKLCTTFRGWPEVDWQVGPIDIQLPFIIRGMTGQILVDHAVSFEEARTALKSTKVKFTVPSRASHFSNTADQLLSCITDRDDVRVLSMLAHKTKWAKCRLPN